MPEAASCSIAPAAIRSRPMTLPPSRRGAELIMSTDRFEALGHSGDDAIPLLTEVLHVPQPMVPNTDPSEPLDWEALADRVNDAVTVRLLQRVDAVIATEVRETLETALQDASIAVTSQLRSAISQEISEVVAEAVAAELDRQRTLAGRLPR